MGISITKELSVQKTEAITFIDTFAGKLREKYITSIPGQDATYISKQLDAEAYKVAGYPSDGTPYKWVTAEWNSLKTVTPNVTMQQTADGLLAIAQQWAIIGSTIESARRTAKLLTTGATTYTEILQILASYKENLSNL